MVLLECRLPSANRLINSKRVQVLCSEVMWGLQRSQAANKERTVGVAARASHPAKFAHLVKDRIKLLARE